MNRDDALFIARRVMDRNREDGAEHLDSIADEILAGEAILQEKSFCVLKRNADVAMQRLVRATSVGEMVEITNDYFAKT